MWVSFVIARRGKDYTHTFKRLLEGREIIFEANGIQSSLACELTNSTVTMAANA